MHTKQRSQLSSTQFFDNFLISFSSEDTHTDAHAHRVEWGVGGSSEIKQAQRENKTQ